MRTHIVLKKEELNQDLLDHIKRLFKNADELEISIAASEDFDLNQKETQEEYLDRLEKAMSEVENKKISFPEDEFFKLAQEHDS
mgnify:CR=1 FL=1